MSEIERYMEKVAALAAERDHWRGCYQIAAAERDALLQAAMDLAATFGPSHSPETWVRSVEHLTAERDVAGDLVRQWWDWWTDPDDQVDEPWSVPPTRLTEMTGDFLARLDAAAKDDQ